MENDAAKGIQNDEIIQCIQEAKSKPENDESFLGENEEFIHKIIILERD